MFLMDFGNFSVDTKTLPKHGMSILNFSFKKHNNNTKQVAALALLLAAIGGADISLQYILYVWACTHRKYTNYGLSEAGSNLVYNRAVTLLHNLLSLCFLHLCLHFNH